MLLYPVPNARYIGGLVSTIVRSVLKIRYLVLGGAIGGGASLAKQYEEWKEGLPDTEWIKSLFPSNIEIDKFRSSLIKAGENIKGKANEIDIDPVLNKVGGFKEWFERRLNAAIEATDKSPKKIGNSAKEASNGERSSDHFSLPIEDTGKNNGNGSDWGNIAIPIISALAVTSVGGNDKEKDQKLEEERKKTEEERKNTEQERKKNETLQRKLEAAQEELMRTQIRYQRELEKLEKENKELKQRLLLKSNSAIAKKQIKKSLIDMYSDVLDELSGYDSSYSHADHLPRVIVIGKLAYINKDLVVHV
jgi:optic atrophy protein 1